MVMRNKEFKEDKAYQFKQKWVSLSDISPYVVKAVIASEDNLFYQHKGFDWKEINIAMEQNKQGKRLRGASTISQQVAKNVFLWPDRSWLRKGLEAYYTVLIELLWNKERIMEVYLNVAEMGKGIFGIEAAAQAYFKKPASKLSAKEAALVAAALPSPLKRNPAKPGSYMQTRQRQILNLIDKLGHLTESNSAQ
jgi:monofunctional biosynthetic peptidoglycan transglycosylase